MTSVALAVGMVCALALTGGVLWYLRGSFPPGQGSAEVPQAPFRAILEAHGVQLAQLQAQVDGLGARHEGLTKEARNAAERARYHAERVAAVLAEGAELEDSAEDVYDLDGAGGPGQGVLPLRPAVGDDEQRPRVDPRTIAGLN